MGCEGAAAARLRRRQEARNEERLALANATDVEITGESDRERKRRRASDGDDSETKQATNEATDGTAAYLNNDTRRFFPEPVQAPNDAFRTPPWFIESLRGLTGHRTRTPSKSPIQFEPTVAAADANERLLEEVGCDLTKLIEKYAETTLGYGSEFRTVAELKPLIGTHPNFEALSLVLTGGMPYVFNREVDQATKLAELKTLLERGNHKSAKDLPDKVEELLAKDVLHGFTIPLP